MIRSLCRLFRFRLVLANAASAAGGCFLSPGGASLLTVAAVFLGVFFVVSAASAFNQIMERDLDRVMERTAKRPLPTRELSPLGASAIAAGCAICGFLLLVACGASPALLALFALAWYLAVYTPLKRRTTLSLPIGAVCGALPPVIGWCAAGGSAGDVRIVLVAALWYLWQVPHFWLLQWRHRDEYRKASIPLLDPCAGGIPALVCAVWVLALIALLLLFPALGLMSPVACYGGAFLCSVLLLPSLCRSLHHVILPSFNLLPLLFGVALYLEK